MKSLFLIDSSALAYRSYYAFIKNPLINSQGRQTSVIYGFASQILRLIQEEHPSHLAIVRDLKKPTFRHKLFDQYKANRKPMPDEMKEQLPCIEEFIEATGIAELSREGFEADDILGTLAQTAEKAGLKVYLVTRDKDLMQVVTDSICLYEPGARDQPATCRGPKEVESKFGVGPEKMVDLLSLVGDSSDNVPGVRKVGPKTAADLLQTYGSLENIYEHVDLISRKALRENLKKDRDQAFLSRQLIQLDCKVGLEKTIDDLIYRPIDREKTSAFLKKWELTSLLTYLPEKSAAKPEAPAVQDRKSDYRLLEAGPSTDDFISELQKAPVLAMDTETTGLDKLTADLVGICVSSSAGTGWYAPVGHHQGTNISLSEMKRIFKSIFSHSGKKLIFHNAKFDQALLERNGLMPDVPPHHAADTMIAAHLLNPGARGLSLDALALKHFGHRMISIESLIGKKGKDQKSFAEVPVAQAITYGAEDADITLRLWNALEPELKKRGQLELFTDLEMRLLPVLHKMELKGVSLNADSLERLSQSMAGEIRDLEQNIYSHAGEEFNIESTRQLGGILFEKLGLKKGKKTKTGYSTDAAVLAGLKGSHPIIADLLDFRELIKLKNTYVDVLPGLINARTNLVHTSYSQTITATGRLSSLNPNLQNIPIRSDHGKKIRECFISRSDKYLLLAADYSQIELRILAHLSADPGLVEAYQKGLDIHTQTASALYHVPEHQVTPDQRRNAKVVNFGVIYGMGPLRLSRELSISREEASQFIENYFKRYAGVREFIKNTLDTARKQGYVETVSGRRRYLPELASDNRMARENAERMAVNTPVQGSAADLIKKAMIDIDWNLETAGMDCDMLLQVHDELVFEVVKADVERASSLIRNTMENALRFSVPLVVDIDAGSTWLEAHN
ncbi:DNA polymerase I [Fibrobacterota bacterium]